ncbi:MAG: S8 family serine peptidase, partial [Candidatus Heimdallarchaeota archaeon]
MNKSRIFTVIFLGLFLFPLTFGSYAANAIPDQPIVERNTFNPVVRPEYENDFNANKIHDRFESIIEAGYEGDMYTTIATFNQPITQAIIDSINAVGGDVVTTWSVIYGAAIRIQGTMIESLASLPGINFLTENYVSKAMLSTSVPQINVRPYVWDTLGFEGSSTDAIAIIDTGIDESHSDIGGTKVVYWEDFVGHSALSSGDEYVTESDWNGHGTHCSSIAAGTGAASSTSSTVEVSGTLGIPVM